MVLVCVSHERVGGKRTVEVGVEVEEPHYVELYGINLVVEPASGTAVVSVGCGNYVPCVFWAALVVVRKVDVRPRDCRALEEPVGKPEEFREAEACRHSEFIGPDMAVEHHLEIPHEAQIEPFPAPEYVLVIVGQLRRNPEKPCRVDRRFQIHLEPLQLRLRKVYRTVHEVGIDLLHFYVDTVEHPQRRHSRVRIADVGPVIDGPGPYGIEIAQHLFPDFETSGIRYGHIVDPETVERPCFFRSLVPRIFVDAEIEGGISRHRQSVRLE